MSEYDGFASVNDPMEYLNAPAMIMSGSYSPPPSGPPAMPPILQAAIDFSQGFRTLKADELQTYYAEQSNLDQRLKDLNNRMDVEFKMREAASSIGRLHVDDRSSIISTKSSNRFSKLLSQDRTSKSEKRLSKQAAEEVAVSNEKIRDMEHSRAEAERRKSTVDRIILQHHCSVMALALTGKPLPNHQRNRSASSAMSSFTTNTQGSRRSWVMAPKHQRQYSAASNGDSAYLATVNEHPRHRDAPGSRDSGLDGSSDPAGSGANLRRELDQLTAKIAQAMPQQSPALNGQVAYIASAFDRLFMDLADTRNHLEASQVQVSHTEARLAHLQRERHRESTDGEQPESKRGTSKDDISLAALKRQLDMEMAVTAKWRDQAESQRGQLATNTKSLEDVTRLSVQLEGERAQLEELLAHLHKKIASLERENVSLINQKLSSTTNSSLLCQEFHNIVSDLVAKHSAEVRALYPAMSKYQQRAQASRPGDGAPGTIIAPNESVHTMAETSSSHSQHENPPCPNKTDDKSTRAADDKPDSSRNIDTSSEPEIRQQEYRQPDSPQPDRQPDSPQQGTRYSDYRQQDSQQDSQQTSHQKDASYSGTQQQYSQQDSRPRGYRQQDSRNPAQIANPPRKPVNSSQKGDEPVAHYRGTDASSTSQGPRAAPKNLHAPSLEHENPLNQLEPPTSIDHSRASLSKYDESYDTSIQYTDESFIRPDFVRQDTNLSDISRSSSYYPDAQSADPSMSSIVLNNSSFTSRPDMNRNQRRQPHGFDDDDGLL